MGVYIYLFFCYNAIKRITKEKKHENRNRYRRRNMISYGLHIDDYKEEDGTAYFACSVFVLNFIDIV